MLIISCKARDLVRNIGVVAYCGNSFEYWGSKFPEVRNMVDLSVLGKPRHLIVEGERSITIENYRHWLWENIDRPHIRAALERIADGDFDALACWCKPLACHCDVIVNAVEWLKGVENE